MRNALFEVCKTKIDIYLTNSTMKIVRKMYSVVTNTTVRIYKV